MCFQGVIPSTVTVTGKLVTRSLWLGTFPNHTFCRKPGHLIADCSVWKRKQQGSVSVPKPPKGVGLIKTVTSNNESLALKAPDDCFKSFIFDGFVSLTERAEDKRPIKVLRDRDGS